MSCLGLSCDPVLRCIVAVCLSDTCTGICLGVGICLSVEVVKYLSIFKYFTRVTHYGVITLCLHVVNS